MPTKGTFVATQLLKTSPLMDVFFGVKAVPSPYFIAGSKHTLSALFRPKKLLDSSNKNGTSMLSATRICSGHSHLLPP